MSHSNQPLVVGAGPVGLGAALFLARNGLVPRVVETRVEPALESKALAVNPRTLDILEPTGVTQQMLKIGIPIHGAELHRGKEILAAPSFVGIQAKYPFLLALSQATTERLLARAFEAAGGRVERGVKLVECRNVDSEVEAVLEPSCGGLQERLRCPWVLAADGAHSTAREELGIEFVGSSFTHEWYLADAPLRTNLAENRAHLFFLQGGAFLFMIRVVDDALQDYDGEPIWRVLGNRPEPLTRMVDAESAGPAIWTSSFHISHRINSSLSAGSVYFAGDAAHIHSPVGARGMNLGLEDAWVFAELVRTNRLAEYDGLRRPVDRRVVREVEWISRIASAESPVDRFVRATLFPLAVKKPSVQARMVRTVTGLDHELPRI